MKLYSYLVLGISTLMLLTSCTLNAKESSRSTPASSKKVSQSTMKKSKSLGPKEGLASYYALNVTGRPTASGEIFDNKKLTAAHKTLPFGTYVKVTALWNNKSTVVRIIDRGPYSKGRIIDLSQAAAAELHLIGKGIGKVRIEVVTKPNKQ